MGLKRHGVPAQRRGDLYVQMGILRSLSRRKGSGAAARAGHLGLPSVLGGGKFSGKGRAQLWQQQHPKVSNRLHFPGGEPDRHDGRGHARDGKISVDDAYLCHLTHSPAWFTATFPGENTVTPGSS